MITTVVENAWKIQRRLEKKMQKFNLPDENTLCWRHTDFSVFFFGMILFFGAAIIIMFFSFNPVLGMCVTDYWLLPVGIGFVFLFLFMICKKVDNDE